MMQERGSPALVIRMRIVEGVAVESHALGCDLVDVAATEASDVGRFTA